MGNSETKMRSVALLLIISAMAFSSEVEDLGAPDVQTDVVDVGEGTKAAAKSGTGGFFSALMTSGSFMMMQAGAFEEEEESQYELGEAPDANRGAASVALGENDQNRDGSEAGFWRRRRRRRTPSGS